MKRTKLSSAGTSAAKTTLEAANLPLSRKSVKAPSDGVIALMKQRKSMPAVGNAQMSQMTQFLTPERMANIFEPPEDMSAADRTRETKRIVAYLMGLNKSSESEINPAVFTGVLGALQAHVDKIDDDNWNVIVQTLLYAMTPRNCGSCFTALEKFVNELLIHRPNYANPILQVLIMKLVRVNNPNTASDMPSLMEMKGFDVAIKLICRVVEVVGVKRLTRPLLNMLTTTYPYFLRPPLTHFYYIRNLLTVNQLAGNSLTYSILSVIIHKIANLDSLLPREILESEQLQSLTLPKVEKNQSTNSYIITGVDAEEFIMEILTAYNRVESEIEHTQQVAALDICLSYVISYLVNVHESLNFTALLSIFEAEILPIFNANCVQFCFFELINLKEEFLHGFLNFLWKKFSNVSTPAVLRVQAVGYIAGVLARSTKVDRRTLKRWISRLATYAHEYLDSKSTSSLSHWSNVNIHAHAPFYAVCQAIFYTFAFRHFELVYGNMPHLKEEDKNDANKPNIHSLPPPTSASSFIYSLNLQRLITSDLNPLKACTPNVAKTFVTAAHAYQISYCKTVLERNNRANIRNLIYDNMRDVSNDNEERGVNLLNESFFPFDPLPLAYCKMIIEDDFRIYDPNSLALMLVDETTSQGSVGKLNIDGTETEDSCDLDFDGQDVVDAGDILLECE
ncbi:RNA polymerase I-specific transcription initiation factor RRN3 [Orchesella cincta]|uniref:RNA polymerase I-specific transcription initiation factor RRN3 n=1 Tax=Orchesella cincta TaxID=48709 RepID=A0A1D2M8M0_ORCCI|nr:RNA polymerase I-specific transcription initiation factor RRN3 [Orchesella cincta]